VTPAVRLALINAYSAFAAASRHLRRAAAIAALVTLAGCTLARFSDAAGNSMNCFAWGVGSKCQWDVPPTPGPTPAKGGDASDSGIRGQGDIAGGRASGFQHANWLCEVGHLSNTGITAIDAGFNAAATILPPLAVAGVL
jgi:hypothetical protein